MIVYTKPDCVQCVATKRWLDKHGGSYEVRELLESPEILAEAKEKNILQAPVVTTEDGQMWGGLQIDLLRASLTA